MKIRFYVDVPEYKWMSINLYATTSPNVNPCDGFKRVAFDVDLPPDVWKELDVIAPATVAGIVEGS